MKILLSACLLLLSVTSSSLFAETVNLRCFYTEVTYDAPFMDAPEVRQCPEERCFYDLSWDLDTGSASVNGLGYSLSASEQRVMLVREAANPIMGGMDKATFAVDTDTNEFRAIRHTAPDVRLSLEGQCHSL